MKVFYKLKYTTYLGFRDLKPLELKKISVLRPTVMLLILSLIAFCRHLATSSKLLCTKFYFSRNRLKTIQRAPMAHRKWSQEQYDMKKLHLTIIFKTLLPSHWHIIRPENYSIWLDATTRAGLHASTSSTLMTKVTSGSNRVFYYKI